MQVSLNQLVERIHVEGHRVTATEAADRGPGAAHGYEGAFLFPTMPIKELIRSISPVYCRESEPGTIRPRSTDGRWRA